MYEYINHSLFCDSLVFHWCVSPFPVSSLQMVCIVPGEVLVKSACKLHNPAYCPYIAMSMAHLQHRKGILSSSRISCRGGSTPSPSSIACLLACLQAPASCGPWHGLHVPALSAQGIHLDRRDASCEQEPPGWGSVEPLKYSAPLNLVGIYHQWIAWQEELQTWPSRMIGLL